MLIGLRARQPHNHDASLILAPVRFNVSLACSEERRSSRAGSRQPRSAASLPAHPYGSWRNCGAIPNDLIAISSCPAPPGAIGAWRTWTGASDSLGPKPCHEEVRIAEEPTQITNSAVPLLSG